MAKKTFFLSDFHLGVPDYEASRQREVRIVKFLESIRDEAETIFLVGDIFDMWYEYKTVVPKGYTRILGKLADLSDSGINIIAFSGNHDMWMFGYFEVELNIKVYHVPKTFELGGKKFLIGHGDGLGPGDAGYKFIKKIFRNPFCQWLFCKLHPDYGLSIANYFSRKSRISTGSTDDQYLGDEKEWLVQYCNKRLEKEHFDFFIFGHRHLPIDKLLGEKSRYINLGDWVKYNSYAVWDGKNLSLNYHQ